MAKTRTIVAVDPATGTRITRRTARTYVAVVVTGDPAAGQAWPQNWAGRPDLAAKQLAKWGAGSNARLAPVAEDPWAEAETEAAQAEPAPVVAEPEAEPAPVVAEPEAEAVAHLCQKFPISTPATWIPAVARLQARGAAVTVGAILRETERPAPVLPGEARPGAAPEPLAQVEIDPYKRGEWQRTGIGPDPVAVAERRAARWAERNPEHSYRVVLVAPAAEPLARAQAEAAPIVAAIAAAPEPVRLNATTEPAAEPAAAKPPAAKPAALLALESLAAGGPLDCATWQALGWPFEGFLTWAQRPSADALVERLRANIRQRGAAACLDSL
jgi:hypothetical protein